LDLPRALREERRLAVIICSLSRDGIDPAFVTIALRNSIQRLLKSQQPRTAVLLRHRSSSSSSSTHHSDLRRIGLLALHFAI